MTAKYGTPFQETEAILAAQEEDSDYLREILNDMLPGERSRLADAADVLMRALDGFKGGPR